MSNILPLTRKQAEREELERACAEYLADGGEIVRERGQRAQVRCGCCNLVRMISVALVIRNRQRCVRCGSSNVSVAL
jgi:hypothetical protein